MVRTTHHALPEQPVRSLDEHRARGGLDGLAWSRRVGSDATIDAVTDAGVRGRGGAGFPTGVKWRSVRDGLGPADQAFVVVNAAEGEPGTFKDRALLRADPYVVLEGALIAAGAIGARRIVVGTKAKYADVADRVRGAAAELAEAGATDGIAIELLEGPDHYLFGEETALLEVLEGEDPLPRHIPPYLYGLYTTSPQLGWSAGADAVVGGPDHSNPAVVNNVESLAHAALVCRHGPDWYASMGTEESNGPTIVTVTGDVQRPVVAEIELGVPLRALIDDLAGGVAPQRVVKGVLSGVSNGVLTADALDTPVAYETLRAAGGGLGSAGFIVYDDSRNLLDVACRVSRFLHVESCGQCNACKTGTMEITVALERLVRGEADESLLDIITRRIRTVNDASRCFLPTQEAVVVSSILRSFPFDLDARLRGEPGDLDAPLPVIADLAGGILTLDEVAPRKRPDWTIAETTVHLT